MTEFIYKIELVNKIEHIPAETWNALFNDGNPFTRHEFLQALEQTACVSEKTGWIPHHLVVKHNQTIVALMPLYKKSHSWGEYVFDWAWAEAYEKHQLNYYPKLVSSIPFTPVTGQRIGFLMADTIAQQFIAQRIQAFITDYLTSHRCSSWHGLFFTKQQHNHSLHNQSISRHGCQFHWHNQSYNDFSDFLSTFASRKRKNLLKERRQLEQHNLTFKFIDGDKANPQQWQGFVQCYQQTYLKRSGHVGYLSAAFFMQLAATMGDSIRLLIIENSAGQLIASALYFVSNSHLYGRYWGCLTDIEGLHFEACYYQGIEYAIKHKLAVFEAGAQGEHKVSRGFKPVTTYSQHIIQHPGFSEAIGRFCLDEQNHIKYYIEQMSQQLPFKADIN